MKKQRTYRTVSLAWAAVLLFPLWGASSACAGQQPVPEQKPAATRPSLYERLGGVDNIAVVIDDVIERSYRSEIFKANPRIHEAHLRYPKAAYKYNSTALACMVMGGPQKYTGRSLKAAHQHLQVTEKEWQELIAILRDSMTSFKVPQQEQGEVIGIIESTKGDIVVPSARSAANP